MSNYQLIAKYDNGVKVEQGDLLVTSKGDEYFFKYATSPTRPGKSGKLFVYDTDPDNGRELYTAAFAEKITVEEQVDVNSLEYEWSQADADLTSAIFALDLGKATDALRRRENVARKIARRDGKTYKKVSY